ncbi:hypothetical protein ONZ45_g13634 [Pleurotus djamor]|nr:hypothetical protein ONZ45_g15811 [Pleurotus djamor]KAJ8489308.1 hypothetical protein ONZ45_g13634 [Pleurotus djamor]
MNPSSPPTPSPFGGIRNRYNNGSRYGEPAIPGGTGVAESPTLTSASESSPPQQSPYRLNESSGFASFRSVPMNVNIASTRKLVVRSDPALVSCFDPVAEKELYELWAPRK